MWRTAVQKSSIRHATFPLWKLLAVLVILLMPLSACTEKPQAPLRISAVLWPGYEPLFIAKKLGYFDPHPIQLVDYLSNTDAMLAFRNNKLEAGAFTFDEVISLVSEGEDIQIILILDVSRGGDVILATPNINSVRELKNKRVAVEQSAVGGLVLAKALALNDMDYSDITIVAISPMEQESEFNNKTIDAAVSFDPYRTHLLKNGIKEIFSSREMPNEIIDVLAVRTDYLKRNPEAIHTLTHAWFKALNFQQEHPRKSAQLSINRFNTNVDDYLSGLSLLHFPNIEENQALLTPSTSHLIATSQSLFPIMEKIGSLTKTIDIEPHLNNSFINSAQKPSTNE